MHSFQKAIFYSIVPPLFQKRTARYRKLLLGVSPTFLLGLEDPVRIFCGGRVDAEYDTPMIFPRMAGEYTFLQLEYEKAEEVHVLCIAVCSNSFAFWMVCRINANPMPFRCLYFVKPAVHNRDEIQLLHEILWFLVT